MYIMRIVFLFFLLKCIWVFLPFSSFGQNSGENPRDFFSERNISVDYATGCFRYTVPVVNLKSGSVSLPVSLSYSGNGVKTGDKPGILGYNWKLNAGGSVIRTMRGGYPDEDPVRGYAFHPIGTDSKPALLRDINLRRQDGESDIFTAVFNGRSISFLISRAGERIIACPLEKTNVRIECIYKKPEILRWIITDESGTVYEYSAPGMIESLNRVMSVSPNDIVDFSYRNSWSLTEIRSPFGGRISFEYAKDKKGNYEYGSEKYESVGFVFYRYGRPMIDYPFAFHLVEYRVKELIKEIRDAMLYEIGNDFFMSSALYFNHVGENEMRQYRDVMWENSKRCMDQIMGSFAPILREKYPVSVFVDFLKRIADEHNSRSDLALQALSLIYAAVEPLYINKHVDKTASTFCYKYPVLKRISTEDKDIVLNYGGNRLINIVLNNYAGHQLRRFDFPAKDNLLEGIEWFDSRNRSREKMSFYYHFDTLKRRGCDYWGFYNNSPYYDPASINFTTQREYFVDKRISDIFGRPSKYDRIPMSASDISSEIDDMYSKTFSLSRIVLPTGGCISVDYESNTTSYSGDYNSGSVLHGGIRVKTISIDDMHGNKDKVEYRYPLHGHIVYNHMSVIDTVYYDSFKDYVYNENIVPKGNAYVNTGNNGLFYSYVEEVFEGKGCNTYLFSIPPSSNKTADSSYPFWLCALPLGTASYDSEGKIVYLRKNIYRASCEAAHIPYADYFIRPASDFRYIRTLAQIKPYAYHMDRSLLDSLYPAGEKPVFLFQKDFSGSPVFYSRRIVCEKNLLPRTRLNPVSQKYKLYYGGKVVLAKSCVYEFSNTKTDGPSVSHFFGTCPEGGVLCKETDYEYSGIRNPGDVVRLLRRMSAGDTEVNSSTFSANFRPDAGREFKEMESLNLKKLPIREECRFVDKSGYDEWVGEKVYRYADTLLPSGIRPVILKAEYVWNGQGKPVSSNNMRGRSFSFPSDCYKLQNRYEYEICNNRILLSEVLTSGDITSFRYDPGRMNLVMQAYGCRRREMDAVDLYRVNFELHPSKLPVSKQSAGGINIKKRLRVYPSSSARKYRLFLISSAAQGKIRCEIVSKGKTYHPEICPEYETGKKWRLASWLIDISSYAGVSSVGINLTDNTVLGVLVPVNACFSATSSNMNGREIFRLDHSGMLERYEYDASGRLIRVYDKAGNLRRGFVHSEK